MCVCVCIYIYIYIYICKYVSMYACMYMYVYVYIYFIVQHACYAHDDAHVWALLRRMLTYADVCSTHAMRMMTLMYDVWALLRRMLTYADVFWRMLTYAARMITYADVCWRMLTYADVCSTHAMRATTWPHSCTDTRMTFADVCWRLLTYADGCRRHASDDVTSLLYGHSDDVCWCMLTCADVCSTHAMRATTWPHSCTDTRTTCRASRSSPAQVLLIVSGIIYDESVVSMSAFFF
jgi:hypothetical protein